MAENNVEYEQMKTFENNSDVLIIDVREPEEIESTGKIGGSINIPVNSVEKVLAPEEKDEFLGSYGRDKPDKDFPLIFSCLKGGRAAKAAKIAKNVGYTNVKVYNGSWSEWEAKLKENQQ